VSEGATDSDFLGRTALIADVDGDENPDVILGDEQAGAVRVYLGDGAGEFSHLGDYGTAFEPHDIDVADLDGDGILDIVASHGNDDLVSVLLGEGAGSFGEPDSFAVGTNNRFVSLADFDRDDLVVACEAPGIFLHRSRSPGLFADYSASTCRTLSTC
jgi:hypothetical protein